MCLLREFVKKRIFTVRLTVSIDPFFAQCTMHNAQCVLCGQYDAPVVTRVAEVVRLR